MVSHLLGICSLAQSVEHDTLDLKVAGSSPVSGYTCYMKVKDGSVTFFFRRREYPISERQDEDVLNLLLRNTISISRSGLFVQLLLFNFSLTADLYTVAERDSRTSRNREGD